MTVPSRLATTAVPPDDGREIGKLDRPGRAGIAARRHDVEIGKLIDFSRPVVALRHDVGDRRNNVDRARIAARRSNSVMSPVCSGTATAGQALRVAVMPTPDDRSISLSFAHPATMTMAAAPHSMAIDLRGGRNWAS